MNSRSLYISVRSPLGWFTAVAVVLACCAFALRASHPAAPASPAVVIHTASPAPVAPPTVPVRPMTPAERDLALSALSRVDRPLRDYLRRFGEFPVGTNADITRALTGANPNRVVFVVHAESPMNDAGELVDPWQSPFFFHQVSATHMEILCAGPDRQPWTADDLKVTAN
jgi:hypothetical protein